MKKFIGSVILSYDKIHSELMLCVVFYQDLTVKSTCISFSLKYSQSIFGRIIWGLMKISLDGWSLQLPKKHVGTSFT